MSKIIFLDIDGVLNSAAYDRERRDTDGNIDVTRLALLKRLVDQTGALIVLSSTWRDNWEKDPSKLSEKGKAFCAVFEEAGLSIYGKTPRIGYIQRAREVRQWLSENPDVESFVIFDDMAFGWDDLSDNLVMTNYRIMRGLEDTHIEKARSILMGEN